MKQLGVVFGCLLLLVGPLAMTAEGASDKISATDETSGDGDASRDSKMGLSQGVDRLLDAIHKRQRSLTEAEREVARREQAIAELEIVISERITALERNRQKVEERIASWETKDGDRIKKLSKVYAAMPSGKAARLLQAMDLDLAVSVMLKMKQKNSAQILALIPSTRALTMSKRMARPLAASPAGRAK